MKPTDAPGPFPDRDPDDLRTTVSRAYAKALLDSRQGGDACCGGSASGPTCCTSAQLAGYSAEAEAHPDALASSFGCGNPVALEGIRPGQTVLDLGSGAGLDLLLAADKVGPTGRVLGVDMTDEMVDAARANVARAGAAQVEVRKGFIEDLPVDDASVDWVVSNCVVNLSPDKARVFSEIGRVLAPGGRISIADIVADPLPEPLRRSAAAYASCIAGAIPEADYLEGLTSAGLVDVAVADRTVYDLSQLRDLVGSDLERLGLDRATLDEALASAAGRVSSVRFVGRRPA